MGLAKPACAGRNDAQRRQRRRRQLGQRQPVRLARIREQDSGPAGVGDHTDPRPGRHRLRRQQRRHVEQLFERAGADHAGLLEQRVHRDVEAGQRRRVTRRGARARPPSAPT